MKKLFLSIHYGETSKDGVYSISDKYRTIENPLFIPSVGDVVESEDGNLYTVVDRKVCYNDIFIIENVSVFTSKKQ